MISKKVYDLVIKLASGRLGMLGEKRIEGLLKTESEESLIQNAYISYEVLESIKGLLDSFLTVEEIKSLYILAYITDDEQESRYRLYGLEKHIVCLSTQRVCEAFDMPLKSFYMHLKNAYPRYVDLMRMIA